MRLLAVLAAAGPQSVNGLADAIGVDQPRASRLVRAAVESGHVRRDVDPADARRSILAITESGRTALHSTLGRRREAVESALAGFTDDERTEFARLLRKFADAWRA
ncbi:MarR family transcriptional regulator [Agromyces sp. MMS17-SY077]|uniref:MarR family transcriptional regulator n=1 Tax=Agromyces seonyuensis TaxID=2662446 RepID=A0A6I4P6Z3_9MICO|nr:MarR family transcriptional regulator [Agromyces seonyuensis]